MERGYKQQTGFKEKLFGVIVIVVLIAIVVTLCVFGAKINKLDKTDELTARDYEKGLIAADGGEIKGTTAIRSKEYVHIKSLSVNLLENAGITYWVFFFDENQVFISATEELSVDFDETLIPENAEYVRFMIKPLNDPEVSSSEIKDYASELIVEFAK